MSLVKTQRKLRAGLAVLAAAAMLAVLPVGVQAQTVSRTVGIAPDEVVFSDSPSDWQVANAYQGQVAAGGFEFLVDDRPVLAFSLSYSPDGLPPGVAGANFSAETRASTVGSGLAPGPSVTGEQEREEVRSAVAWLLREGSESREFPDEPGGSVLDEPREYAALQLAIWNMTDGIVLDENTVLDADIRQRAVFFAEQADKKKGERDVGNYRMEIEATRTGDTSVAATVTLTQGEVEPGGQRPGVPNAAITMIHLDSDGEQISRRGGAPSTPTPPSDPVDPPEDPPDDPVDPPEIPEPTTFLSFDTQPTSSEQNVPFDPQPVVEVLDADDDPVVGETVTLRLYDYSDPENPERVASGLNDGTDAPPTAITDADGEAVFAGVRPAGWAPAGADYRLHASVDGANPEPSEDFVVAGLRFYKQPPDEIELNDTLDEVVVEVIDTDAEPLDSNDVTLDLFDPVGGTINPGGGVIAGGLVGTLTQTTDGNGRAAFDDLKVANVVGVEEGSSYHLLATWDDGTATPTHPSAAMQVVEAVAAADMFTLASFTVAEEDGEDEGGTDLPTTGTEGVSLDGTGQAADVPFTDATADPGAIEAVWSSADDGRPETFLPAGTFFAPDDDDLPGMVLGEDTEVSITVIDDYGPLVADDGLAAPEEPEGTPVASGELPFTGPSPLALVLLLGSAAAFAAAAARRAGWWPGRTAA